MSETPALVIERYIRSNLLVDREQAIGSDTQLITQGLVDSMGLVLLAAFVEEHFGVRIDDADLRAGELETIGGIVALIDGRA